MWVRELNFVQFKNPHLFKTGIKRKALLKQAGNTVCGSHWYAEDTHTHGVHGEKEVISYPQS